MKFIGTLGIDYGGSKLDARHTKELSFRGIADWYVAAQEYSQGIFLNNPNVKEIRIAVYTAESAEIPGAIPEDELIYRR